MKQTGSEKIIYNHYGSNVHVGVSKLKIALLQENIFSIVFNNHQYMQTNSVQKSSIGYLKNDRLLHYFCNIKRCEILVTVVPKKKPSKIMLKLIIKV